MTLLSMAVLGRIAGGYWCSLLFMGVAIAGVGLLASHPVRRKPALAWFVGLAVSTGIAYAFAVALVLASYEATFWRVFGVLPPPGTRIRFTSAQRTVALSDGAALVVIDDLSRDELVPLLASGQFTRDQSREESIAASPDPAQMLAFLASGTRFLEQVAPSPTMEIYVSSRTSEYWAYVIYFPETKRAYAFYLEV